MAERVIWERTVDQNKIRERSDRFRKRFFPAAGLILLIVLVVTGWQNTIGALFVVGLVGMVWGNMVRYQSLSDAANPVMTVTDGRLKLGDRTVIIEDVKRFTTIATSLQTSLFGRHSRIHLGKAIFRMDMPGSRGGPDLVEFGWPNMIEEGVATVQLALEAELDGKWVAPGDMVDDGEVPKRTRRPRLRDSRRA
jgi:hypothetical protein